MSWENANMLVKKGMERMTLTSWLRGHNIKFNERADTEELRQLYIKAETTEKEETNEFR